MNELILQPVENSEVWEAFLRDHNYPTSFFQSWTWGQFEKQLGHQVTDLGIYLNSELIGIAQTVLVTAKRGKYLHIRNGPVTDWADPERAGQVIKLFIKEAEKQKCDFLRFSPLLPKSPENEALFKKMGCTHSQMHDVDAEVTWMLDLNQTEDQILAGMRKTTRYLVKQGLKNTDLKVFKTTDIGHLPIFWEIYQDTVKRQKWNAYSFEYISHEFEQFVKSDQAVLFLVQYKGMFIAASIFIYYLDTVYYHHSGSLSEYRNLPAMYLLQWQSILEAKKRGFAKYNFFGIARTDDPKHPWSGLSLFKKGFGGYKQEWQHALDMPLSKKYWLTHYFEFIERKRRGY